MNTFTYVISSLHRISVEMKDCRIQLSGLDPSVRFLHCEVACLCAYSGFVSPNSERYINLKVENSFVDHSSYYEKRLDSYITIATYNSNNNCYSSFRGKSFIIPNFNNKVFHFFEAYETNFSPVNRSDYSQDNGNWFLYLYLTPIDNKQQPKLYMNPTNLMSCFISSSDKLSGNVDDCLIRMPNIPSQYKRLYVMVQGFIINYDSIVISGVQPDRNMTLRAFDLIENGFQSDGTKLTYLCSIPVLKTDGNNELSNDRGSIFICRNWSNRIIKFQLMDNRGLLTTIGHTYFDQNGLTTNWILQLSLYPIE